MPVTETYGQPIHGEVITADATTALAFILYDLEGIVIAQGATERIQVDWLNLSAQSTSNVVVFFDIDSDGVADPGESFLRGNVAASASVFMNFHPRPAIGPEGVALKALGNIAANTHLTFGGHLLPRRTT